MATEIIDTTPINDSSALGVMAQYQQQQMSRQEELDAKMLVFAGLALAQMIIYYRKADEVMDERNCVLGEYNSSNNGLLGFLAQLEEYRDYDNTILELKKGSVAWANGMLSKWKPNSCTEATRYIGEFTGDSKSIKEFEKMFIGCSCSGAPEGWGTHDGSLARALGAAYAGPMMDVAAIDAYEDLKGKVVELVLKAQTSMKAIYNISSIMSYYSQAYGIYQGLADLYISGFNSGAAMLGVSLGNLYKPAASTGNTTVRVGEGMRGGATPIQIGQVI